MCGFPASSIYWHFKDKDDLIAAVIDRSFATGAMPGRCRRQATHRSGSSAMTTAQIAKALMDSPDFLRLGLMLALERRPVEASARAMFLQARAEAHDVLVAGFGDLTDGLTAGQIDQLVTYAVAGADGLFIAKEIGGDAVDLVAMFALHAGAIFDMATRMAAAR